MHSVDTAGPCQEPNASLMSLAKLRSGPSMSVHEWLIRNCSFLLPNVYRLRWLTYRHLRRLGNSFSCAVHKSAVGFWIVNVTPEVCTRPTWFQLVCACARVSVFSSFSSCTSEVLGPTQEGHGKWPSSIAFTY